MLRYRLVIFDDDKIINQVNFATLAVATEAYEAAKAKGFMADIIDSHESGASTNRKLLEALAS